MQSVLFLDIDGVLNSTRTFVWINQNNLPTDTLDPVSLALLKFIKETTFCKIVVSSSWRVIYTKEEIEKAIGVEVDDLTPILNTKGRIRGNEIDLWMENNYYPSKYAIMDDDSDFLPNQKDHLVKTKFDEGLGWEHAQRVIQLL